MNKIGLSYSRCVKDIVEGKVDIDDVLVIIARTNFDPRDDSEWKSIWQGYCTGNLSSIAEWNSYNVDNKDHELLFRNVSIDLYETGKFHQPRKFGFHPRRLPYFWLEVGPSRNELDNNPPLKRAWEQFQIIAGLTNDKQFDEAQ